jgi:uncharacterized protein
MTRELDAPSNRHPSAVASLTPSDTLLPRAMSAPLIEAMADNPVVCLLGPRQCGKSTLARQIFPGRVYLTLDDQALRATATADPTGFVAGLPQQATIDEIQRAHHLLPAIKMIVDRDRTPGRFLLTGSANLLLLPTLSESLAGRMAVVRLHPFAEAEKERGHGGFLARLIAGGFTPQVRDRPLDVTDLVQRLLRGGYPEAVRRPAMSRVHQWHRDYLDALVQRDVRDVANLRDLELLPRLFEMLALQTGELLNVQSLAKHLGARHETIQNHLAALERLFLVRRLPAWHTNAARRLVKTPKIHVTDSGLAATSMDVSATDWTMDRSRFGHLLESFVVQQLVAHAGWTDPDLRFWHYRDKDQVEVDVVITRGRETWGVEVKSAASVGERDGAGIRRLAQQCGRYFRGGIILYTGTSILPTSDARVLAVPMSELWT